MEMNRQIRNKVKNSNWRDSYPYRNGGNPKDTFNEIVNDSDRHLESDLRPYSSYKTKQGEWQIAKDKLQISPSSRWGKPKPFAESVSFPLPATVRRQYPVPADATRYENFAVYWGARAKGLEYTDPFLHARNHDDYGVEESRRYQRLFWAPVFIPRQPSCRHARSLILTAY